MRKSTKVVSMMVLTLVVFSSFAFVGCTKRPNAEQLQALEEQKNAALSAENTLEDKRREKNRLESQLNQKRKELQDTKTELEDVKKRLAQ